MIRSTAIITSATDAIAAGTVLHVRAAALPGIRRPLALARPALPEVDLTLGPDGRGGFLVVDYSETRCGREERLETAREAVRWVWRQLGGVRLVEGLGRALVKVYGEPDESTDRARWVRERHEVALGATLNALAGGRVLRGPLFGPSGVGTR